MDDTVGEVTVAVRVRPGASRAKVGGRYGEGDDAALVVAVTQRAVDGRATEAALRGLADATGLRRADVRLVSGATSRTKVVALRGRPAELRDRVVALRDG